MQKAFPVQEGFLVQFEYFPWFFWLPIKFVAIRPAPPLFTSFRTEVQSVPGDGRMPGKLQEQLFLRVCNRSSGISI